MGIPSEESPVVFILRRVVPGEQLLAVEVLVLPLGIASPSELPESGLERGLMVGRTVGREPVEDV